MDNNMKRMSITLCENCPYSEFLWSVFSRIRTEYEETRIISPYSVRIRENTDQNNSEYGHFLRSVNNLIRISLMVTVRAIIVMF